MEMSASETHAAPHPASLAPQPPASGWPNRSFYTPHQRMPAQSQSATQPPMYHAHSAPSWQPTQTHGWPVQPPPRPLPPSAAPGRPSQPHSNPPPRSHPSITRYPYERAPTSSTRAPGPPSQYGQQHTFEPPPSFVSRSISSSEPPPRTPKLPSAMFSSFTRPKLRSPLSLGRSPQPRLSRSSTAPTPSSPIDSLGAGHAIAHEEYSCPQSRTTPNPQTFDTMPDSLAAPPQYSQHYGPPSHSQPSYQSAPMMSQPQTFYYAPPTTSHEPVYPMNAPQQAPMYQQPPTTQPPRVYHQQTHGQPPLQPALSAPGEMYQNTMRKYSPPSGYPHRSRSLSSAASPMDPFALSAINSNRSRGNSRMRDRLLEERFRSIDLSDQPQSATNPMSPEEIAAARKPTPHVPAQHVPPSLSAISQPLPAISKPPLPDSATAPIDPEEQIRRRARAPTVNRLGSMVKQRMMMRTRSQSGADSASGALRRSHTEGVSPKPPLLPRESNAGLRRASTAPVSPRYDTYIAKELSQSLLSPLSKGFNDAFSRSSFRPMTRRYRALVIGVSYEGTSMSFLRGTLTDVREVFALLTGRFGFNRADIRVLCDQEPDLGRDITLGKPTLNGIYDGMNWLVEGAQKSDSLFFFFAGHGKLVTDYSGDERDSEFDQCLVPLDASTAGFLVDDHIFERLVCRIPFGARLTCLIDACTSGTVCDLPFMHTAPVGRRRAKAAADAALPPQNTLRPFERVGETVLFAGSADLQEAADVTRIDPSAEGGSVSFGVFTRAFVEAAQYAATFGSLLQHIRAGVKKICEAEPTLRGVPQQMPQLSSSHDFEIYATTFSL